MKNPVSIFLGFVFFGAGMAKLYYQHKYIGLIGPVWLEDELKAYNLGFYARFIAYSQVIIGYLLLTVRFRTLGAIMILPMILNILMVTISLNWKGTPYVVSVFLMMAIYLLWTDRQLLLHLIGARATITTKALSGRFTMIWIAGLFLNLLSIAVSFWNIYAGWVTSAIGITLSFLPLWLEKANAD